MMTLDQLKVIMPNAGLNAIVFLPFLNAAMERFDIKTPARQEMFLATIAHESGDLNVLQENLNYSAAGLYKTWPSHFPSLAAAAPFARNPEKIANHVYANKNGNGTETSGDGWKFRGAGLIQLTFRNNQHACAVQFSIEEAKVGAWLLSPEGASMSAAWFWSLHDCNVYADKGDFDGVCDEINIGHKTVKIGDAVGYKERLAIEQTAEKVLT